MNRINRRNKKKGITLLEVTVVSGLMTVMAMLLSTAWIGMGRPTVDAIVRGGLFQEMDTAVSAFSQDLGGSLAGPDGRLGGKIKDHWVGWLKPAEGQLWLCFDGGAEPDGEPDWGSPDTVVVYQAESNSLIRWNQNTDTTFTVAKNLDGLTIAEISSEMISITMTFQHRGITRSCTLLVRTPEN